MSLYDEFSNRKRTEDLEAYGYAEIQVGTTFDWDVIIEVNLSLASGEKSKMDSG